VARAGEEIVNSVTGERIVFRTTAAETSGWNDGGRRAPDPAVMLDLLREFPREIAFAPTGG